MHKKQVRHSWNVSTLQLLLGSMLNTIELVFLTARPWAERGSCSARSLFFTNDWAVF